MIIKPSQGMTQCALQIFIHHSLKLSLAFTDSPDTSLSTTDQLYQLFPDHNGRTNALRATKNKFLVLNGVCDHCAGAGYYGYEGGWGVLPSLGFAKSRMLLRVICPPGHMARRRGNNK